VGTKIYPLVADTKTSFPFIVYRRTGITYNNNTKDRILYKEIATLEIRVASDKYDEGIEIAEAVRSALLNIKGIYADLDIYQIELVDSEEIYNEDTYLQNIIINIKTNGSN
jgi:hypothetical protein